MWSGSIFLQCRHSDPAVHSHSSQWPRTGWLGPSFNATLHRSPVSLWGTQVQSILSSEPAVTMMQRVMQATPMDTRSSVLMAALSRTTWPLSFLSPCSHALLHGFPSICLFLCWLHSFDLRILKGCSGLIP